MLQKKLITLLITIMLLITIGCQGGNSDSNSNSTSSATGAIYIDSISPPTGYTVGGQVITIRGENFTPETKVFFGEEEALSVRYVSSQELKVTTPMQIAGGVNLKVIGKGDGEEASTEFEYEETPVGYKEKPYIVSARALDATHILIQYSEPMSEDTAKQEYYQVYSQDGATLEVLDVTIRYQTQIILTTMTMSEIDYTIRVTGVVDKAGRAIKAPEAGIRFNEYTFSGSGESVVVGSETQDSDGDGISDADEQRGYLVTFKLISGESESIYVTSDPSIKDTDGDGVSDQLEFAHATNPRSADSDHDGLSDDRELNIYNSDPLNQDSDGDGLTDGTELDLGTSLSLADTDSDQFNDAEEINMGTNPRVANLPLPLISIESISAAVDIRYTETTTNGTTNETSKTFEQTLSSETSSSSQREISGYIELGNTYGFSVDSSTGVGVKATVGGYANWEDSSSTGNYKSDSLSSNYITENTREISKEIEGARISVGVTFSTQGDIAFTLKDIELSLLMRDPSNPDKLKPIATLLPSEGLEVNLGPLSNTRGPILFHADNPIPNEVDLFLKNPSLYVVQIANYNMVDENNRNFAYTSQDIVQKTTGFNIVYNNGIRKNEHYRIATTGKFDPITAQPIGINLKEGLKAVLLYQVDDEGESIASLERRTHPHPSLEDETVSGEFYVEHTFSVTDGQITRVKDVQISYTNGEPEGYDYWVLLNQYGEKVDATSLETTYMESGGEYTLLYTKDLDGDGLSAAEETIIGTKDTFCDSDNDGVSDYREHKGMAIPYLTIATDHSRVQAGELCPQDEKRATLLADTEEYAWRVATYTRAEDGNFEARDRYFRAYSNPLKTDSDDDGLNDLKEFQLTMSNSDVPTWRADPYSKDTDDDGLEDKDEVEGYTYISIRNNREVTIQSEDNRNTGPYINVKDSDNDYLLDGVERVFGSDPTVKDKEIVADTNHDGLPDKYAKGENGNFITACETSFPMTNSEQSRLLGTAKSNIDIGDVDGDGIPNVWEYFLCTNPLEPDTDGDGLKDNEEWNHKAEMITPNHYVITPENYAKAQSACDYALRCQNPTAGDLIYNTDPKLKDTDGDGLDDNQEIEGWTVWLKDTDDSGNPLPPIHVQSNPRKKDTDGDGIEDGEEYTYKTNPLLIDSDGDGKSDTEEIRNPKRDPLIKDAIYQLKLMKLTIIDNSDSSINEEDLYDKGNASGLHFSNIHLTSALGELVNNKRALIDRNTIFYEMMNTKKGNEADRATTSWHTSEDNQSCTSGLFKKAPIYDNDLFVFSHANSSDISITSRDEHYLSFSINIEINIDQGCDDKNEPASDRFMVFDGTLKSKAKIDIDSLIDKGSIMIKLTQDDFIIRTDGTRGDKKVPDSDYMPILSVVFIATKVD